MIANALDAMAAGADEKTQLGKIDEQLLRIKDVLDDAIQMARHIGGHSSASGVRRSASYSKVLGTRLKDFRTASGWSQERLANAMSEAGFDWKRMTCTQVEADVRRLGLDELVTLAALFGVPVIEFLLPPDDVDLALPNARLERPQLRELLIGKGGNVGEGGVEWSPALRALGSPFREIERPAEYRRPVRTRAVPGPSESARQKQRI
jgi:transcriptional regulator with XRE-family HTH domain